MRSSERWKGTDYEQVWKKQIKAWIELPKAVTDTFLLFWGRDDKRK